MAYGLPRPFLGLNAHRSTGKKGRNKRYHGALTKWLLCIQECYPCVYSVVKERSIFALTVNNLCCLTVLLSCCLAIVFAIWQMTIMLTIDQDQAASVFLWLIKYLKSARKYSY